jgi:shikimate dehydrogenase
VAGIIGDPVRHSLSPALHNAAFDATGIDWVYVAFPVATGTVPAALEGMRALGIDGLSVTMPHKGPAAEAVDRLSPSAARLKSVNTVLRQGDELLGESTDGQGFLAAVRKDEGWDPAGRQCVILGAGGAARALALALGEAGAASVVVVSRRPDMAAEAAALAGPAGLAVIQPAAELTADADLVVNATPVGMRRVVKMDRSPVEGSLPFDLDPGGIGRGQLVVDLIYSPAVTPLLRAARERGARTANGLGMLIHQAALQFRLWTGEDPPLEVMSAAAMEAISRYG